MDQASASIAAIKEQQGLVASRRRILQGAVVAAAPLAVGGRRNPLMAFADDNTEGDPDNEASTLLRFSSLAGIQMPFLGDAGLSAFRGVHGGGAPWIISEGNGSLASDGHLEIRVRGLFLDPAFVPAPKGGTNPIPAFVAIVSGFSADLVKPVIS